MSEHRIVSRTERIWFRNYNGIDPLVIHRPLDSGEFMPPALRLVIKDDGRARFVRRASFVGRLASNWLAIARAEPAQSPDQP